MVQDLTATPSGVDAGASCKSSFDTTADGRTLSPPLGQHARLEGRTKGEIFTSFDVNAFEVPGGRDENGGSPRCAGCAGLLRRARTPATGTADIAVTATAPGSPTETVSPRWTIRRSAGPRAPADRVVRVQAFSPFTEAALVTVETGAPRTRRPRSIPPSPSGRPARAATAYGHLQLVDVGALRRRPPWFIDHAGGSGTYAGNVESARRRRRHGSPFVSIAGLGRRLPCTCAAHRGRARARTPSCAACAGRPRRRPRADFDRPGTVRRPPGGDAELLRPVLRRRRPAPGVAGCSIDPRATALVARMSRTRARCKGVRTRRGPNAHTVWVGDVLIRAPARSAPTPIEIKPQPGAHRRRPRRLRSRTWRSTPAKAIRRRPRAPAPPGVSTTRQVFYLRSRGIPEDQARRLIVRGFFNEIIAKISVPAVRERLTDAIEEEEFALTESIQGSK